MYGTTWPRDLEGYPVAPGGASPGAVHVYVSRDDGDDANPGTQAQPVRTLARAAKLMRVGVASWMHLHAENTWGEALPVGKGGPSPDRPWVYTTYAGGEGTPRPQVRPYNAVGVSLSDSTNVVFDGLHFRADRAHPADAGYDRAVNSPAGAKLWSTRNVAFMDCLFELFRNGLQCEAPDGDRTLDLSLFRCLFRDCYAPAGSGKHSQGGYVHNADGVYLEEVVAVHCGWLEHGGQVVAKPTVYNHSFYFTGTCDRLKVRGLVTADAAATGLQARCGGEIEDVFSLDNPHCMTWGLVNGEGPVKAGGCRGFVSRAYHEGGRDLWDGSSYSPRGIGLTFANAASLRVRDVVVAWDNQDANAGLNVERCKGVYAAADVGVNDTHVARVVVRNWGRSLHVPSDAAKQPVVNACVLDDCYLPNKSGSHALLTFTNERASAGGNRNLAGYMAAIGDPGGDYAAAALLQSRSDWQPALEAKAVVAWVLAGDGLAADNPPPPYAGGGTPAPTPGGTGGGAHPLPEFDPDADVGLEFWTTDMTGGNALALKPGVVNEAPPTPFDVQVRVPPAAAARVQRLALYVDGRPVRQEANEPRFFGGDDGARPKGLKLPAGVHALAAAPVVAGKERGRAEVLLRVPGEPPPPRPPVKLPRVLDSVNFAGRPERLHPGRHLRRCFTSTGWQMTSPQGYDSWAVLAKQHDAVMTPDQETLPEGDGSGYPATGWPTGLEPEEEFRILVGHQVWALRQFRERLGPDWPIGTYALLPRANYYVPMRRAAYEDPTLDGTPSAWLRDPNHPEVKLYAVDGHAAWQKGNDRIAAAALPHVDFLCPQVYHFNDDLRVWDWLLKGNVAEARRLAGGKPVYPFVTPAYFEVDGNPRAGDRIKYATFRHWLESTLAAADGVVVWGYSPEAWDENAEWLKAFRDVCDALDAAGPVPAPPPVPTPRPEEADVGLQFWTVKLSGQPAAVRQVAPAVAAPSGKFDVEVRVDAAKAKAAGLKMLTLYVDGKKVRDEKNPPYFFGGDDGKKPKGLKLARGTHTLRAVPVVAGRPGKALEVRMKVGG